MSLTGTLLAFVGVAARPFGRRLSKADLKSQALLKANADLQARVKGALAEIETLKAQRLALVKRLDKQAGQLRAALENVEWLHGRLALQASPVPMGLAPMTLPQRDLTPQDLHMAQYLQAMGQRLDMPQRAFEGLCNCVPSRQQMFARVRRLNEQN